MPVPIVYRKSNETAVASYDFYDIAEGSGIITFNGFTSYSNDVREYNLSSNSTVGTNDQFTTYHLAGTIGETKVMDLDFDVVFNTPKRIKGNVLVSATIGIENANSGSRTIYFIAKLRKVSNGVETEIANAESYNVVYINVNGVDNYLVKIPLSTIQSFSKGDTLRLTIEVYAVQSTGSSDVTIWHDPQDLVDPGASTTTPASLKLFLPVVIDL
jgi:hypothetical protein